MNLACSSNSPEAMTTTLENRAAETLVSVVERLKTVARDHPLRSHRLYMKQSIAIQRIRYLHSIEYAHIYRKFFRDP
jgi:ribosomal protein L17